MKKLILTVLLAAFSFSSLAVAGTVKIPSDEPVVTVKIPDSWKPEETDHGYAAESPDQVATIFLEATTKKGLNKLIDENVDWLTKEQDVKIIEKSKKEEDVEIGDRKWSKISWDANSKEFGPSVVGFLFSAVGNRIMTVTYWITKKDADKHFETIGNIFLSIKEVSE